MQTAGVHSLEVVFDFNQDNMTSETEAYYQKYSTWYELVGAAKLEEFVYITCQTSDFKPVSKNHLIDGSEINTLDIQEKDDLYECFYRSFVAGKDRTFSGKNENQRRSMFDGFFSDPEILNTAASLVL